MTKREAVAMFTDVPVEDVVLIESDRRTGSTFKVGNKEYLVCYHLQADNRTRAAIRESVWAFNPDFILKHAKIETTPNVVAALREMQGKLCESANPLVLAMIRNFHAFAKEAISIDGRGHFISGYDGQEHKIDDHYIYRIN
jgi:hypothetical protein